MSDGHSSSSGRASVIVVSELRRIVTAAEMDRMTPMERAAAVDASIVRDWDQVPPGFRREVEETARRLSLMVATP